jgi:hypothetical protein
MQLLGRVRTMGSDAPRVSLENTIRGAACGAKRYWARTRWDGGENGKEMGRRRSKQAMKRRGSG